LIQLPRQNPLSLGPRRHGHRLDGLPHPGQDRLQLADDLFEPSDTVLQRPVDPGLHGVFVEIVADPDLAVHLADAVNAANALFDPHGVPGHVVVDEHAAGLQVQPLAGRLGAEQDLDRFALLEGALDCLLGCRHPGDAVPHLAAPPAVAGHLSLVDLSQLLAQEVPRVGVLGEDDDRLPLLEDLVQVGQQPLHLRVVAAEPAEFDQKVFDVLDLASKAGAFLLGQQFGDVGAQVILLQVVLVQAGQHTR